MAGARIRRIAAVCVAIACCSGAGVGSAQPSGEAERLAAEVERLGDAARYAEALELARRVLAMREKAAGAADPKTAAALADVGALRANLGDRVGGEEDLRRAVAVFEQADAKGDEPASALADLALLTAARGQARAARPMAERAVQLAEQASKPDAGKVAAYQRTLGVVLAAMGESAKAEELFRKAIATHDKSGPRRDLALDLLELGGLLRATAKTRTEETYRRAFEVALESLGPAHPTTASIVVAYGRLFWGGGQAFQASGLKTYASAYETMSKALGDDHPGVAALMQDWAVMKEIAGDLAGSLELRRRADAIEERELERRIAAGTETDALDYARVLYRRVDFAVELALGLGAAEKSREARRYALELVLRRKGQVLAALRGGRAAFREHATADEKRMLDALARVRGELARATVAGPGADVAEYKRRIADLEGRERAAEAEVVAKSRAYRTAAEPVTLAAVQGALPAGSVLVELYRWNAPDIHSRVDSGAGNARYVAFIVQKDNDPYPFILGDARSIDGLVHELRAALAKPGDDRVYEISDRLSRFLVMRLDVAMRAYRRVFVAPDGELNLVPFAALLDSEHDLLVRNYELTYLSSGRDLIGLGSPRAPSVDPPTIVADPSYDGGAASAAPSGASRGLSSQDVARMRFPPLPGTRAEASAIAPMLPAARVLTGEAATEGAVKALRSPRVLHVATHGFFLSAEPLPAPKRTRGLELEGASAPATAGTPAPGPPPGVRIDDPMLRSGLALAGANARAKGAATGEDDGVLTALEASTLDLAGTQLVVLSACETGVGEVQRGQGVFSLRRALVEAGAATQVMSLWEVDDDATKRLMTGYYEGLFHEGKGRSQALRDAQLAMLGTKATAHPFFWSAFIVSGDPSPIASAAGAPAAAPSAKAPGTRAATVAPGARGCGCGVAGEDADAPAGAAAALAALVAAARRARRRRS